MIAAAELSRRLLMVSQSRRYFQQLSAFRRQIAAIAPVGIVQCSFFKAPRFPGFREQMPYPLLADMAIHQFDLARDLIGGEPLAVYCESFNPEWSWFAGDATAQVTVEFAGGAASTLPAAGAVRGSRRPGTVCGGSAAPAARRPGR